MKDFGGGAVLAAGVCTAGGRDAVGIRVGNRSLTPKKREVLALRAQAAQPPISETLFISGATVKTHLTHLYEKLGVKDRQQAITTALAEGLLE